MEMYLQHEDMFFSEIAGIGYNHKQVQVLLAQTNDPYACDKNVGDSDIGLAQNVDLPADITSEVELHQHDFESKDVEQVQGKKKGNKRKLRKRTPTLKDDLVGQTKSHNSIEDFGQ